MEFQSEHAFGWPACGADVSVVLDTFAEATTQQYIEDCEICCRPLVIRYSSSDHEIDSVSVTRTDE